MNGSNHISHQNVNRKSLEYMSIYRLKKELYNPKQTCLFFIVYFFEGFLGAKKP